MGMTNIGKAYERNVYSLLDMLGNVGGLYEAFKLSMIALIYVSTTNTIDTKIVNSVQNNIMDFANQIPDLTQSNTMLANINSYRFQITLFIYRMVCCQ